MQALERMPLQHLLDYDAYTQQHGLPLWRLEMQLARIAMLLDGIRIGPGAQLRLTDYLIGSSQQPVPEPPSTEGHPTEQDAEAAAAAFAFNPRNRQKKSNAQAKT